MGESRVPAEKGRKAAASLHRATSEEEKKIEARKGSDLAKGAKRFDERSRSSDGKGAGAKQRP